MAENLSKPSLTSARRRRSAPWLFLVGVVLTAIVIDQATKAYVVAHLDLYESWMPSGFVRSFLQITLVHNTGAAFGMFAGAGYVFLVIALVVSGVIVYYFRQLPERAFWVRLALGLQLGGALSNNLIDRARLGYVVDFFDLEFWPLAGWPVFNVADSCIVIGVALLAFEMLREEYRVAREKREAEKTSNAVQTAPPDPSSEESVLPG